jgi:osmoprotectant transport system substrate-binding protein/osmoprotectant transport system permease protein
MAKKLVLALSLTWSVAAAQTITVGSKSFTESYVLAEIMAQLLEHEGFDVDRQLGFAGTRLIFEALSAGEIDVYPEYSGTIEQTILESHAAYGSGAFAAELGSAGIEVLEPLGFDNSYALAVTRPVAERFGLSRISDLRSHPQLELGFSHEFRDRDDGWPALRAAYGLPQDSIGIDHGLAYRALLEAEIDVTDAYTTDADLARYDLVVLADDLSFFPRYLALPMVSAALSDKAKTALNALAGRIDDETMRSLNAAVAVDRRSFADVANEFLYRQGLVETRLDPDDGQTLLGTLLEHTWVHLQLTGLAVAGALVAGVGLALAVYRSRRLSAALLYVAGLLQTVPSIAMLALLIPLLGVGQVPAIVALFLYALLPIARNTITALVTVDPLLRQVAAGIGLTELERLRYVYLPLALPHLLAGLRIAVVVSIGTATLAAFIGAGGLGEPIVTGLALNDSGLILQGAIPAALLAIAAELGFELVERLVVPRHLVGARQSA